MVGLSSDPGTRFYFHLLAAVAGTLVVADILVEDSVHALCNTPKYTLVIFDMFRVFCKHNLTVS